MTGAVPPRQPEVRSWAKLALAVAASLVAVAALPDTLFRYDNNGNLHVVTDPVIDPNNCGGPGLVCPARANATSVCRAGACDAICAAGWGDCDSSKTTNGCETRINSVASCGACGLVCPTPDHGAPVCNEQCGGETCSARCGISCFDGYTECGGRCVPLATDVNNCGACGIVCPGLANGYPVCTAGACGLACLPPFAICGQTCLDPLAAPTVCQPEDPGVGLAECVEFPVWDMARVEFGPEGTLVAHRLPQCAGLDVKWPF
jgi:hypothetical protein